MKKLFLAVVSAVAVIAAPLQVGDTFPVSELPDQFEKTVKIDENTQQVIISFTKAQGAHIKTYLDSNKGYLKQTRSVYAADVTPVPSFVMSFFMLPKFEEYDFSIGLIDNEEISQLLPKKEEKITILTLDNQKVTSIKFVQKLP